MISKNRVKQIQFLHQKKFREQNKLFLAEGIKTVKELIASRPEVIEELFATVDFIKENEPLLKKNRIGFSEISEKELGQISSQTTPNQVLAVCRFFEEGDYSFDFEKNFSLYLDDIRDPGNFGTIIRMADWFGISTIFCSPSSCELYNNKVIQATMGAFMRVKVVYLPLNEVMDKNKPAKIYGAVLNGKNLFKEKLEPGLILIGNEANGINKENLELINAPLTIPSHSNNGTESLNAAMATSIIVSEFFRQICV
ncbi:MAG: tRNA/rRNA methyltransferase (SpoU) [Bacteroidetes bacterium]|jgi:TrmH family RNA methyltransferase|nr:tRNA/rRNA methyltransferase (SpoU) [Bacteroidota bacterium]